VIIEGRQLILDFVHCAQQLRTEHPLVRAYQTYKQAQKDYYSTPVTNRPFHYPVEQEQCPKRICLDLLIDELQTIEFQDNVARDLSTYVFHKLDSNLLPRWKTSKEKIQETLQTARAHWKHTENAIPAKEYWEKFSSENPNLKPKHVWYYDIDPTTTVYEFLRQNNIGRADTSETESPLLGFDDNHVLDIEKDQRANVGHDNLVRITQRIIE